ncbi:chaperonin complex component [Dunaliella salina]|uniref:Chaperonin complex component n=1 Tax=Dunaliella salina TaxID=3046 RepID=A0ABQ7GCL2_DUNSA|nr:chaperonin complex component [Dunaliella salina]|eukprot:KAF5832350.1 chaperonin complex component [Dunaliella salina]
MSAVKQLNANAEQMGRAAALFMNINAAKGLHDVMKTNLGPKGTIKMLVDGAGAIKLTKDGNVLLREMQIQNPTAVMIARTSVAQDEVTGDGTTSMVLMIGELMKAAERYLGEGTHPRVLVDGLDVAKAAVVSFLEKLKHPVNATDRETLRMVARTSLRTKLNEKMADRLTDIVTDAVLYIRKPEEPIDLYMVRIYCPGASRVAHAMVERQPEEPIDVCLVRMYCHSALVLAALYPGAHLCSASLRRPLMCACNAEQRERLVAAEREVTDERVRKIIDLKRKVCGSSPDKGFVVINQKGIDPISLDMLAKEGIMGLRRAKKRNMERLQAACGGFAINSVEELVPEALGKAGHVYEHVLGEEKYTFVEDVQNPQSVTILLKGQSDHVINQIKDAVRDGLRAVKNTLDDSCVLPGAGAFEVAAAHHLRSVTRKTVEGRAKLGIDAFADALLGVAKVLAENSGYDPQEVCIKLQEEFENGNVVGLDVATGEPFDPIMAGVLDNFIVKKQIMQSAPVVASQLLLVDEVMRAGVNMRGR